MAVKIVDVGKDPPRPIAILVHGDDKTGKTSFAGTFPNPVFIVPAQERGTSSLKRVIHEESLDGSPQKSIQYIAAGSAREMEEACAYVRDNYKKHGWRTVVIDPLTTYGRILRNELVAAGVTGWDLYSGIGTNITTLWRWLQGIPLHIVWVCHTDDRKSGDIVMSREPKLDGQDAIKTIRSNVDLIMYTEVEDIEVKDAEGKSGFIRRFGIYTKCPPNAFPRFVAGGRWEELLPKQQPCKPHFNMLANRLKDVILL